MVRRRLGVVSPGDAHALHQTITYSVSKGCWTLSELVTGSWRATELLETDSRGWSAPQSGEHTRETLGSISSTTE